jgi:hypothetical protein
MYFYKKNFIIEIFYNFSISNMNKFQSSYIYIFIYTHVDIVM